jgi:hypothetical protein
MITWKLNPLVVDISHYNLFDFGVAKGYVDLVICKCGELTPGRTEDKQYDITFATNIQKAKDNAIAAGAYIYLSPDYYIVNQLAGGLDSYRNMTRQANLEYTRLRTWIAGKEIYCLMFDLEKQWINAVPAQGRIPSNWVIANLDLMYTHVKQGQAAKEIPDVPLILYTSDSYSKAACIIANDNALYTWVAKHPDVQLMSATWIAPTVACYWSEVRKYLPADNLFPPYINSAKIPMFWQFSAAGGIKPGTDFVNGVLQYRETDLSCCSVTRDDLYKWLKYNQVAPPTPPEPPVPPAPGEVIDIKARARLDVLEAWAKSLPKF